MQPQHSLSVVELFAGVGGFRLGLEGLPFDTKKTGYEVIWSNQYEPATRVQHASEVYQARWPESLHANRNIEDLVQDEAALDAILALNPDMLVGGFPCQDYSVAKPLSQSAGLQGKKGVLFWSIHKMLQHALQSGKPVHYLLLENVDRLIQSPSAARGRDFAVILSSLASLGYAVEWRVINAADYGFPQRRRRTFILAYHKNSPVYALLTRTLSSEPRSRWLADAGVFGEAFPATMPSTARNGAQTEEVLPLSDNPFETQTTYMPIDGRSRFRKAGLLFAGQVWSADVIPVTPSDCTRYVEQSAPQTLGDIVSTTTTVPANYYLDESSLRQWAALKGAKRVERIGKDGFTYTYSEGAMTFPDALDAPSRTVITSEGCTSASRTTHVVRDVTGELRRLIHDELEALNGFPRGFTAHPGVSERKRAFFMGNALVVGVVRAIGQALLQRHSQELERDERLEGLNRAA